MEKEYTPTDIKEKFRFKSFHELMTRRVSEILLISSTYDAFIMQEDGPLAERIIHEYRGLNLSRPPRLSWLSTGAEALGAIEQGDYDLVIVMPHISDFHPHKLCARIKALKPHLPIYFLAYDAGQLLEQQHQLDRTTIDRCLIWSGNTDLLLAIVKNEEDRMNVHLDTDKANIRVIIFVEDSPLFLSSLLPVLYREIVLQTQAVMDDSLNERDRLLRMRTRPKILVAENYEQAWDLYRTFKKYLFCVISDVRFAQNGQENSMAGITLLSAIRKEQQDLPLLILSTESDNRKKAEGIGALFSDKNSPTLHSDINTFFIHYLGFGDFLFRLPNGEVIGKAGNLRAMARQLISVPAESLAHHARRNDFSRWLMARYEMEIAHRIRNVMLDDFANVEAARQFLIDVIKEKLKKRQQGLVSDFSNHEYDPDSDFIKIGKGSLGGKARGLAFISHLLRSEHPFSETIEDFQIALPKTIVITTEGFDLFSRLNSIRDRLQGGESDQEIRELFKQCHFPEELRQDLRLMLEHIHYPLAIRSSAILEDAHYRASAGAYNTYMLPNNHSDISIRLEQLTMAIKLVYSSIFQETPRILARNSVYRQEDDKMAVIIQQLIGHRQEDLFYPAISGVAQSYNFYPVSHMKPEDGVAHIAMGLGKIVVDGGVALRFCPKYPTLLPQFSTVDDILRNAQRFFFALRLDVPDTMAIESLTKRIEVDEAAHHYAIAKLASSFNLDDGRLRDSFMGDGPPIITFATILKYNEFPLAKILDALLALGQQGMGCPVEIEFAVNMPEGAAPVFTFCRFAQWPWPTPRLMCSSTQRRPREPGVCPPWPWDRASRPRLRTSFTSGRIVLIPPKPWKSQGR